MQVSIDTNNNIKTFEMQKPVGWCFLQLKPLIDQHLCSFSNPFELLKYLNIQPLKYKFKFTTIIYGSNDEFFLRFKDGDFHTKHCSESLLQKLSKVSQITLVIMKTKSFAFSNIAETFDLSKILFLTTYHKYSHACVSSIKIVFINYIRNMTNYIVLLLVFQYHSKFKSHK